MSFETAVDEFIESNEKYIEKPDKLKDLITTLKPQKSIEADNIEDLFNKVMDYTDISGQVRRNDFQIVNDYYNAYDNIYSDLIGNRRKLEYDEVDRVLSMINPRDFNPHVKLGTVARILAEFYGDADMIIESAYGITFSNENVEKIKQLHDKTLKTVEEEKPKLYEQLGDMAVNIFNREIGSLGDIKDYELNELYGIKNTYEFFDIMRDLDYWKVYFEPPIFDADLARKCGLVPFTYHGDDGIKNLLALAGCGMDLSPKLDAYQALMSGSLPRDSRFIDDDDYAKYVVGEKIYEEVIEEATKSPEFTIHTWGC